MGNWNQLVFELKIDVHLELEFFIYLCLFFFGGGGDFS